MQMEEGRENGRSRDEELMPEWLEDQTIYEASLSPDDDIHAPSYKPS